ncbi:TPA: hypothetical protein ACX87D_001424 [Legionella pneumophila]
MGWTDRFWNTYRVVTNTVIEGAANSLNAAGSLACMVGGAGLSLSYSMSETIKAGYFGSVGVAGTVNLDVTAVEFNYGFNQTIPFRRDLLEKSGGGSYALNDFANPGTIFMISSLAILSGTALRTFGANLKKWQQNREDKYHFNSRYGTDLEPPSYKEYLHVNAESFCNSLAIASFSSLLAKNVLDFSIKDVSKYHLTYPFNGTNITGSVNTPHYTGPVTSEFFPLDFFVSQNTTIHTDYFNLIVNEKVKANAMTNVTYGGGVLLEPSHQSSAPLLAATASIGISSYLAGTFFGKKVLRERDERLQRSRSSSYSIVSGTFWDNKNDIEAKGDEKHEHTHSLQ